jgi:hypothetical protein
VLFFGRNSFADNSTYLFLRALSQARGWDALWATPSAELAATLAAHGLPHLHTGRNSEATLDAFLHAAVAVFTVNPLESVGLSPSLLGALAGAQQLQLWHGISVKKLNLQLLPHLGARSAELRPYWLANCGADHVLSTAACFDAYWREVFGCRSLLRAGMPRNEVILRPAQGLEWLGAELPERAEAALRTDAPAILVVPTWQRGKATALTEPAFLAHAIQFSRRTGAQVFFKAHPTYFGRWEGGRQEIDGLHLVDPGVDIYPWMHRFDALVTDYSSILFDFLLTGRPALALQVDAHQSYEPDWGLVPAGDFRTPFSVDGFADTLYRALTEDGGREARLAYAQRVFETDPLAAGDALLQVIDTLVEQSRQPDHRVWQAGVPAPA